MMKLFAVLALLAIATVGLGFYQGWFSANSYLGSTGTEVTLKINHDKFKKDKEQYQKKAEARLKELDGQLEKMAASINATSGDARIQLEKDVETLKVKKEAARKRLGEIQEANAETWDDVKSSMDAALDDLAKGFESAAKRFK